MTLKQFADRYTLPLSMLIGVIGYKWFHLLNLTVPLLMPTLIFLMLLFTFCKINPLDLRLHKWHWIVLFLQIALTFITYYCLLPINDVLAQGIMLCFVMPTATAGPIIAGKLGGSIQSLTSFTILSNLATIIIVPLFFPIVYPDGDLTFLHAALLILKRVGPLLLGPFFLAWAIRLVYNAVQHHKHTGKTFHLSKTWASLPFYLWAVTLVVLMADLTYSLLNDDYEIWVAVMMAVGAAIATIVQFALGKAIGAKWPSKPHGEDYEDVVVGDGHKGNIKEQTRISAGQAFGQKNTTLGMWMATTFLNPLSAIAPAAYIIWQNAFNSWQLATRSHQHKVTNTK